MAGLAGALMLIATPVLAQEVQTTAPATAEAPEPSQNAMVNLVRLLVAKGVLSPADGDGLMKEALSEAAQARAAAPIATIGAPPAPAPDVLRVPYIPELVRNQIKDEVKQEVMAQARDENWAQPNALPEWLKHIEWSGDLRVRDEFDLYAKNNDDQITDFATFNANGPFDLNTSTNATNFPFLNTRQDRTNLLSVRARLGMKIDVTDAVTVGVRLATGKDNSPVSTTQVLGGGLGKKDFWLDQAYVTLKPVSWGGLTLGRMPNPFFHTDILYDDDLNFDGAAVSLEQGELLGRELKAFATVGAFPLEYGAANYPSTDIEKSGNLSKWLLGAQIGAEWSFADAYRWKIAVAYYDFQTVQGRLSAPCNVYNGNKFCSTDQLRPAFMQKGDTLSWLRDNNFDISGSADPADPQFAGLTYDFNVIDLTSEFDIRFGASKHLLLQADYARNLAYGNICGGAAFGSPVTNFFPGISPDPNSAGNVDPCSAGLGETKATYQSGPNAWMVKASFGDPQTRERGRWNFAAGYKYIEPDAVIDGLNDSDFHLGGTNAKGWFVAGSVGLFDNVWLTARWLSADEVFGPPLSIDVGQIDLNIGF